MATALQPASEILLRHGPYAVTLRASLRAAVALETMAGGIAAVWDDIARQKLTALYAVIRATATDRNEAERLLAYAATKPLGPLVIEAQAACLALLMVILAPAQGGATNTETTTGPEIPLRQFYTELFSLATSWLHWPPSEVWNASVAEIVTALEAQAERDLRRVRVTPEDEGAKAAQRQANIAAGLDPDFDRAGLQALKSRM
jgi:hypothetical protein